MSHSVHECEECRFALWSSLWVLSVLAFCGIGWVIENVPMGTYITEIREQCLSIAAG